MQDLGAAEERIEWCPSHHENHAFEALFAAQNSGALETPTLAIVIDRVGQPGEHQSAYLFDGSAVRLVDRPCAKSGKVDGYGIAYDRVTAHLGWRENTEAGKTMALAAYGAARKEATWFFDATAEPQFLLPADPVAASALFSRCFPDRRFNEWMPAGADLAAQVQFELEVSLIAWIRSLVERFQARSVVFSGGLAANCKAIGAIAGVLPHCIVQGSLAPNDAGQPIGALVRAHFHAHGILPRRDPYGGFWLAKNGPHLRSLNASDAKPTELADVNAAALAIANGDVVELLDHLCEPGPRALGFHSYVCDARRTDTATFLAGTLKSREPFRPFGALFDDPTFRRFFGGRSRGQYMDIALPAPRAFAEAYPACVHVDRTCRVQTLGPWHEGSVAEKLIRRLNELWPNPVLVNTSLNGSTEPLRLEVF
nr:carbamoyltransferase C-terminal domain-containing protein [Bradyrhizobium sp. 2S1]MCK7664906.1 hypothetical protein [Bradyrhizobium sp. 2S1]